MTAPVAQAEPNDGPGGLGGAGGGPIASRSAPVSPRRAFLAVLGRDLFVTGREAPIFFAQVILQPLFLLFVFGRILSELGYTKGGYAELLFPGIVALTATLTSLQSTAFPLVIEFSYTKEIEDRLLAPLPVAWVAVEKLIYAALRALIAAAVMFPVGILVLGSIPWRASATPFMVLILVLGALNGGALGLTLGTLVPPNRINIMFALVLTPLLFTGCSQYPWPSLSRLAWFKWLTTLNPMTYISEGMRAALVPKTPHMEPWICVTMSLLFLVVFGTVGIRGFLRRAID
jgi:ABC-2 type transport system permease protein